MLAVGIIFAVLAVLSMTVYFKSSEGTKERLPRCFGSFLGTMAVFFIATAFKYTIQLVICGSFLEAAYLIIIIGWFADRFFKKSPHDETDRTLGFIGIIIACFYIILILLIPGNTSNNKSSQNASEVSSSASSSCSSLDQSAVDNAAKSSLTKNGWTIDDYVIGSKTNAAKDHSESGNDTFSKKIVTKDQLGAFISKGDSKSKVFLQNVAATAYGKTYTSGSAETQSVLESEVADPDNWSDPIQSNIPFRYPGNTGLSKNGVVYQANSKSGDSGDIFFMYVPPESLTTVSSSVASDSSASSLPVAVRGACGNPQLAIPTPAKKTTQSSTPNSSTPSSSPDHPHGGLTPKSPNPNDYIVAGKGKGNDVDSGSAPKATVNTPPESRPPIVATSSDDPSRNEHSKSTDQPGSTTSAAAPGSSSAVSNRPSSQQLGPTTPGTVAEPN